MNTKQPKNWTYDTTWKRFRLRKTARLPAGLSVIRDGRAVTSVPIIGSGRTKQEAQAAYDRKLLELHAEAKGGPPKVSKPGDPQSVVEFLAHWLDVYPALKGNKPNEIKAKRYHAAVHIEPFLRRLGTERGAPLLLHEVTAGIIDQFQAELQKKPKAPPSKKKKRSDPDKPVKTLSAKTTWNITQTVAKMLVTARRWGHINEVPEFDRVHVPKPTDITHFSTEEVERLIAKATTPEDRALLLTAFRTGARVGELLALRWSSVDFERRTIRIDRQLQDGALVEVKAGSARTVPLSAALADALSKIRHERRDREGRHFVFCSPTGAPFSPKSFLRKKLATACRRANIPKQHPHATRHTFAIAAVRRGVPLPTVQAWLGHTTLIMTARYLRFAPGTDDALIDRLDAPAAAAG